jgi:hypothetical protein
MLRTWKKKRFEAMKNGANRGRKKEINWFLFLLRRSQWLRSLRHKMSPPARQINTWFRIPLESLMSVCHYSVCVALILRLKSPTSCLKLKNWSEKKPFTDGLYSIWEQQEQK